MHFVAHPPKDNIPPVHSPFLFHLLLTRLGLVEINTHPICNIVL